MAFGCKTPYIYNFNQCSSLPFPTSGLPKCCPPYLLGCCEGLAQFVFPRIQLDRLPPATAASNFLNCKISPKPIIPACYCFLINCSLNNESSQVLPNFRTYFSAVTTVLYYGWVNSKCQLKKETVSCHFNCCIPGLEWGVLQPRNLMQWYKVFGCIFRENMLWLVFLAFWAPGPRISVGVTADSPELAPFCFLPSRNCSVASANLLSTFPPCLEHRPQPEF